MPKIFTVSNVTKRGKEQLLDYINRLITNSWQLTTNDFVCL
jgi:hypothetical protein